MTFRTYLAASAAGLALASLAAVEVHAQQTTSAIRGAIITETGASVPGASVRVIDTRTGAARTLTADSSGGFSAPNLNVGGPYSIEASAPDYQSARLEGVFLTLGDTAALTIPLAPAVAGVTDVIVVTASRANVAQTAMGPSATFTLQDLETAPAINRDLKDIIRQDPRIYLDEGFSNAIQCAGAHPRFNSLTVDGIGLNDAFGLNANGYPTERMPFPYDAISQVSVELAPFDVQYGGFTACNINAVTKSGSNEFRGSLFFDYTDSGLRGKSIEGQAISVPKYDEKRYGFTVGGPILRDRLFFFAAYEKFEGQNQFFRGPEGSGAAVEVAGFTQADYDRILNISQGVYGYDPGGTPSISPADDEKYLIRLDANITDNHRAAFTYNYNSALNLTESDGQNTQFEYFNHLYNRGAKLRAYSGQIFSNWTDNFSTELRASYNDVDFTQRSVGGTEVGEIQISHAGNTIYLGADDSRHSNQLNYTVLNLKAAAAYRWGAHTITGGYERLTYDIFNMFVQNTQGRFHFDSIDDFEAGQAWRIAYGNASGTNNPDDAAANFSYDINTLYLQDEFGWGDFIVTAGLRYEWYTSSDRPNENPNFLARNGFSNTENLSGKSLLQPRFGFTWDVDPQLTIRGGAGLYSGGNPNVWVANSYSNDGITNIQRQLDAPDGAPFDLFSMTHVADEGGQGRPLWGIPSEWYDFVAGATANSTVNAIDPNFKIPAEWKLALGATYDFDLPGFGDGYRLMADILYSKSQNSALVRDAALEQIGTAPDGRPIYRRIDRSHPDCAIDPASAACPSRGANNDLILTNADGGEQLVLSVALQKSYDFGLDWSLAYAYVESKDVSPMTSSVAFSNWTNIAISDINDPREAASNYQIPHRFTGSISFERAFIGNLNTRISLFGQLAQSRPFSFTFNPASADMFGEGQRQAHLLYVPQENDPRVVYGPDFDVAAFDAFIARYGLARGAITERNAHSGDWTSKFDLRVEQELPGALRGHRSSVFFVVENIGNLINDNWGVLYQSPFPQRTGVVDAAIDPATGAYVYRRFFDQDPQARVGDSSFWTIRLGVKYAF